MNFSSKKLSRSRILALLIILVCAGGLASCKKDKEKSSEETAASTSSVKTDNEKESASLKPQTMCPVMGGAVNKSLYVDVKGYRIYVCCSDCINEINKDPDKYIKKLQDMGVEITKAPQLTPASK
ncbi:MAG: hypothetical protein A2020_07590 [Lentisphaerae bacterium GWF2_45_14]|nr:MAG: hypothetical protein A2020_07590 [Lentisphaerae bacterium GWF2_45_14]